MRNDYKRADAVAKRNSGVFSVFLFVIVLVFFALLGLAIPLRPSESMTEKRELETFPEFELEAVLDGSYFKDVSEWYSDTFPMRDFWMSVNDRVVRAYGIQTTRIIQGNATKDEIPTIPAGTQAEHDTQDDGQGSEQQTTKEAEERSTEEETAAVEETTSPAGSGEEDPSEEPHTSAGGSTGGQEMTVAPIAAETQNGLFVHGDAAYGIYYFNRGAADLYISAVNRLADRMKGQAQVYCILAPLSASLYLNEETLASTDGSDEKAAIDYYYASMNSSVKKVEVYDTLAAHTAEYLYFRTDHHWNGLGAYYAYRTWAAVKGITPHEISEYTQIDFSGFLGSYYADCRSAAMESNPDTVNAYVPLTCNTMTMWEDGIELTWPIINDVSTYTAGNKYSTFAGADHAYSEIFNENVTNGQVCLMIKDSYGNALIPYLTDHYQTIYWIDYRYYDDSIVDFAKTHDVNDIIFVNGTEPITSREHMERLNALIP